MNVLPPKAAVITALRESLEALSAKSAARAEATRADATHEEARAENDKDTRGLETSYLARGQAKRTEELAEALHRVRLLSPRTYGEDDAISLGALVLTTRDDGESRIFFLIEFAGGTELHLPTSATPAGESVVWVVTPTSPVGRALVGKFVGDDVEIRRQGSVREYEIEALA